MNNITQSAIITGAGSGIGAAIAQHLAGAGYRVVAVGRSESALRETAASDPQKISTRSLDVGDRPAVDKFVASVTEEHGRIDVLVNSAGTNTVDRSSATVSPDEWDRILKVNATGAFNLIQAVLPQMRTQGGGTIVNISSVAGKRAIPLGGVAYNASKFAMTALGTTVGEEQKEHGIRVTNIYPGEVETPILDARPVPVSAEHRAKILQPEDVASAVLLACTLPARARIPELVIVPTTQSFVGYQRPAVKALLLSEYKNLDVVDVEQPTVGDNDVLVQVKACGICGSDIHGYDGSSGRRIPPLVMGHEAAGIVAETGKNVTEFTVGDRVTFDSTVSCGECYYCRRGDINLCDNRMVLGVSCDEYRRHGAFAEFVSVPQHICYRLPEELPFEHAAMIEAVSVAVHAANRTPVSLGDTAVVVGSGMIGLLAIQAIRLAGCSQVIAVDLDSARLEKAKSLGADVGLRADKVDVPEEVRKLTNGRGADVVLEVVGATATIQAAIESARKGGSITLVGNLAPNVEMPLQSIVTRELNVLGTCASSGEYPACVDLLASGAIRVDEMITAKARLEEGPAWFARLYDGEPGAMKVILEPAR